MISEVYLLAEQYQPVPLCYIYAIFRVSFCLHERNNSTVSQIGL